MSRTWEIVAGLLFLALCLLAGLGLARWAAPKPAIGVVRFDTLIDTRSTAAVIDLIEAAAADDRVAGVVLEIATPGGLASASENIFYSLLRLREVKPLVAVIDGTAASGGYYMAVAGNRIYAPSSAYLGNVGTRGPRPEDPAISPNEISSGPYKLSGGSRFDRLNQLEVVAGAFVGNVVHQRQFAENPLNITAETVAEGRIYLGSEAMALGLIDAEGGRTDGILAAAELAGVARYDVIDLTETYGIDIVAPTIAPPPNVEEAVVRLAKEAPPDAVFLLDSRIPLPGVLDRSALDEHLLRLRKVDPGSLKPAVQPTPAVDSTPAAEAEPAP